LAGGIDFVFPNLTLSAGGHVLVVGFDPVNDPVARNAFTSRYNVPGQIPILGPYAGKLENDDERVGLYRPDPPQLPGTPDAGYVPYVLVETVRYSDTAPWSALADGTGDSLQRRIKGDFGNEPLNWFAASPTAGLANSTPPLDADNDGLPDDWERAEGLSPAVGTGDDGPDGDPDGDGMTNLEEYQSGTQPSVASSVLRLDATLDPAGVPRLTFQMAAGHSYSIHARDEVSGGAWVRVALFTDQPQSQTVLWTDPEANTRPARYYTIVTPAQP
jgi:hypothetical protein